MNSDILYIWRGEMIKNCLNLQLINESDYPRKISPI